MNTAEEDWWGRFWGDLRGLGPADSGECGVEGRVGTATQTGSEDGGRSPQEVAG